MKNLCLLFGIIFLVNCSTAQYSYVYEIRHDNKRPRHEELSELSPYRYSTGSSEQTRPEEPRISSGVEPKTRDFSVKAPEMGPSLLNIMRNQLQEKKMEPNDNLWASPEQKYGMTSSLALQSNTDSPTYARQSSPNSYIKNNELPLYREEKYRPSPPKGYPILESRPLREQEPKLYEQRPVYASHQAPTMSSTRPPHRPIREENTEEKLRTVHSIQTPNYRIQLVSKPESLDKLLPLLEQYRLSQKPFQSESEPSKIPSYLTGEPSPISYQSEKQIPTSSYLSGPSSYSPGQSSSYSSGPSSSYSSGPSSSPSSYSSGQPSLSSYSSGELSRPGSPWNNKESDKGLVLSVEPDAQILEPMKQSQIRESRPAQYFSPRPISHSMYDERDQLRDSLRTHTSQPMRQYSQDLKSEPRPILDMPRQELPPQIQQLKGRPIPQLQHSEPRTHQLLQSRNTYSKRDQELVPMTALYQMSSPDLSKGGPPYSRVEYSSSEDDSKREGRRPTPSYKEEPMYRVVERPQKIVEMPISDLNEQISKLGLDPSAQKALFDQLKSQSMEMSDRSRTKYGKDEQPQIVTDPNYKPSPIPEEYKPFTQTRYYKTYV